MNGRTCIVTRKSGPADDLIRFVAAPDGRVVADLKHKLPGRGCWVTAERKAVDLAVKKRLFARALKAEVTVPEDLGAEIDRLMLSALLGMMGLARKAGQFVTGAMKVDQAVRGGQALAVFHALDAAADGVRKIDQARHAARQQGGAEAIPAFALATSEEMQAALGEGTFIHCAALAGQAGQGVVKRATWLDRYRHGRRDAPVSE
ncbi:MAG TPA: RNA-binding protein [Pararhizobium sp.]|nr:RNA-binding protein [Pararhizobium sp.]